MSRKIGIGFIGAGTNTRQRHLPGFKEIEGVRLVSVANRSEESSAKVAEEFGIEKVALEWRAVVNNPEVDAVCIGTWPHMHAKITLAALEEGKHVLTEARMAATRMEASTMLAAAKDHSKLVTQVVPSPFTLDVDARVKAILAEDTLGDIREVFVDHATDALLDPEAPLSWRLDPVYSGINMLTLGIYHEVVQRWFPDLEMTVEGAIGRIFTKERTHWETGRNTPVELPDCLHVIGEMEGGAVLNYHFSGIDSGSGQNEIRIVGSKGSLRVDVASARLYQTLAGSSEEEVNIPDEEKRGWRVEADFIDSIRDGKPVQLTSFEEGVRYMKFTDAVYQAIRQSADK